MKRYEIKRGSVIFREEKDFKTFFHELFWRLEMKIRGFKVRVMDYNKGR